MQENIWKGTLRQSKYKLQIRKKTSLSTDPYKYVWLIYWNRRVMMMIHCSNMSSDNILAEGKGPVSIYYWTCNCGHLKLSNKNSPNKRSASASLIFSLTKRIKPIITSYFSAMTASSIKLHFRCCETHLPNVMSLRWLNMCITTRIWHTTVWENVISDVWMNELVWNYYSDGTT